MAAAHRIYAEALFEAARDAGRLAQVREALGDFAAALEETPELRTVLRNPQLESHVKSGILAERVKREAGDDAAAQVRRAFRLAFQREASSEEVTAAVALDRIGARGPRWILWAVALFTAVDLTHFGANKPMNSSPGSYKEVSNEYEIGGSSEALANLHRLVDTTTPPVRIDYLERDALAAITASGQLR